MPHKDSEERRLYHLNYKRNNRWRYRPGQAIYDRVKHANQRAAEHGAPGVITADDVAAILAAGRCHYCGATRDLTLDHVVPLSAGGPNSRSNLVAACRSCNASKSRSDRPHRWARLWDCCQRCGRTESRHYGRGLCNACAMAERTAAVR